MKIKRGVILAGLKVEMRPVLVAAEKIWKDNGRAEGITVTAGLDGEHSAGSVHYYGYALDLRTRYWERDLVKIQAVVTALRKKLGKKYDVVVHASHIHVEYKFDATV